MFKLNCEKYENNLALERTNIFKLKVSRPTKIYITDDDTLTNFVDKNHN